MATCVHVIAGTQPSESQSANTTRRRPAIVTFRKNIFLIRFDK